MESKAVNEIELLKNCGNNLREPYSKYISNGIFELRIKFSSDISRIFYFFYIGNKIILTNGFIKKTQKTPQAEIEKAIKYKMIIKGGRKMKFDDFLKEELKDKEFKEIYERDKVKYDIIAQLINERAKQNLSQKELAEKIGTKQTSISRFENGNTNASLDFLIKIANSLGKKLEIKLI